MRILYITNSICGAGGLERVLAVKASLLTDRFNHEIHIVALNEDAKTPPFFHYSDKIIRHNLLVSGHLLQYYYQYKKGIQKVVKQVSPDVISVCDDGLKGFFVPKIVKQDIPIIYERHASINIGKDGTKRQKTVGITHRIMKARVKDFDRFIVLTKGNLKEWNAPNLQVIPNPVSFQTNKTAALKNKTVIAVGSHSFNKGTDLLVKIWQKVAPKFPQWRLEVYGKSTAENTYEKLAATLKINNICFFKPTKRIQDKYLLASIMMLPSRSEGFGMVIIEAMACGLPVISFNCPHGPADIITQDKDGFLVESENTDAFAKKLEALMLSNELREKIGARGKETAKQYAPLAIATQWDQLFKGLIS